MMFWLFGSAILGAICIASSNADECPPSQDIYPCYCGDSFINCENLNSLDRLASILKHTKGKNFSYAVWKSRLGDIPSDFFEGHKATSLHFENCKIGSFGDKPFSGLENTLKTIYIYGSVDKRVKDLKTFPLAHLTKLEDVSFMGNDIVRLGNDWFNGGPVAVRQLNLEANDIEELGDKAFASLVNVEQIWTGDNRYKKVFRSMFPRPANKLELLEMSFNGIEVLPEDLFEDMPNLKDVNVSGNKLKTVPEATWGKIWNQLDEVYLERNVGFQCDDQLKWIYQRKLPRILTGRCPGGDKFGGKELKDLTLKDFE